MEQKKLVTVRLNKAGVEELERLKSILGFNKNAPVFEELLLVYRSLMDESHRNRLRVEELEQEKRELHAIIAYLEGKNDDN